MDQNDNFSQEVVDEYLNECIRREVFVGMGFLTF